jgi:hypothetical protein
MFYHIQALKQSDLIDSQKLRIAGHPLPGIQDYKMDWDPMIIFTKQNTQQVNRQTSIK